MKKLIIVLVLAFSLIGCTGGEQPGGENTPVPVKTMEADATPNADATPMEGDTATPEVTPDAEETPAEGEG